MENGIEDDGLCACCPVTRFAKELSLGNAILSRALLVGYRFSWATKVQIPVAPIFPEIRCNLYDSLV